MIRPILRWVLIVVAIPLVLAGFAVLVAWVLWRVEPSWASPKRTHFWYQVLSGNWAPDAPYPANSFAFALSAATAMLLGLGPIIALLGLIFGWIRPLLRALEQEKLMNFAQLANSKDAYIKTEIYKRLFTPEQHTEETRRKIDDAIASAKQAWVEGLNKTLPPERAQRLWRRWAKHFDI
jgi:hypothetical protein